MAVLTPDVTSSPPEDITRANATTRRGRLLVAYVLFEFACQVGLLIPAFGSVRALFRSAAFGVNLVLLAVVAGPALARHPARAGLALIIGVLVLNVLNPGTENAVAAAAQIALYVAIFAPIYWVARLNCSEGDLQRVLLVMWLLHTASAVLGVLQAYFPGSFQPPISQVVEAKGIGYLSSLEIELASGARVFRPMGLTDRPGGAAEGGFHAVLLGLGIAQTATFRGAKLCGVLSMLVGVFCLSLCQIRARVVVLVVCLITIVVLMGIAGRLTRMLGVLLLFAAVSLVGLYVAISVGGASVVGRLGTLVQDDPVSIYYNNRGGFLDHTIDVLLPKYPFGAGLARWGMIHNYFGSGGRSLWAEIQWTAWLYDGGLPMILAYCSALAAAVLISMRIALNRSPAQSDRITHWATIVVGYNIGTVAMTFSYPVFAGAAGAEFWLLNAALLQAARARGLPPTPTVGPSLPGKQPLPPRTQPAPLAQIQSGPLA